MDLLIFFFFGIFVLIIGIIPFRVLYVFSDFFAFILFSIIGYRKDVVLNNLRKSFPDKSENEIIDLAKLSYKNLSDITIEGIKIFTMSSKEIQKRHKFLNPEVLSTYFEQNKSVILLAAHYCNWEWGGGSLPLKIRHRLIVLYKPLSNKYIDRYLRKIRERDDAVMASILKTSYYFKNYFEVPAVFVLVADQSPSNPKKSYWVDFFGLKTAFLKGPEIYAHKYKLPVLYIDIRRSKRGYYEFNVLPLVENLSSFPDGKLTEVYAQKLEEVIRKKPENWLWSHRRWKLSENEK